MKKILYPFVLSLSLALAACGGGGDSTSTPATTPATATNPYAAYVGNYSGSVTPMTNNFDWGDFRIAVDANGNAVGDANVKSLPFTLRGTVSTNGAVAIGLYQGNFHGQNWTGTIDKTTGAISGRWEHAIPDGTWGTFEGRKN